MHEQRSVGDAVQRMAQAVQPVAQTWEVKQCQLKNRWVHRLHRVPEHKDASTQRADQEIEEVEHLRSGH